MSNLADIEKELNEASNTFLATLALSEEIDPEVAAKLDVVIGGVGAVLKGRPLVSRAILGKLVPIPLAVLRQADRAKDPAAVRAAALHYQEMICAIFAEAEDRTGG